MTGPRHHAIDHVEFTVTDLDATLGAVEATSWGSGPNADAPGADTPVGSVG
jgi:uncharacterized lipoprotein